MTQLDPPLNMTKLDWRTIAWDAVENAEEYDIYYNNSTFSGFTTSGTSWQFSAGDVPVDGTLIHASARATGYDESYPGDQITWYRDQLAAPGSQSQYDVDTLQIGGWGGDEPFPDVEVRKNTTLVATITDYTATSYLYDFSPAPSGGDSIDYRFVSTGFTPSEYSTPITWNTVATLGGTNTGSVTEDGTITTSGTLTITDPDSGEARYRTRSTTGTYGSFTIGTNGVWTYTLNNSDNDTNALTAGQTATDVFLATSNDGSASRNVTITITGAAESGTSYPTAYDNSQEFTSNTRTREFLSRD